MLTNFATYVNENMNNRNMDLHKLSKVYAGDTLINKIQHNNVSFIQEGDCICYTGVSDSVKLVHDCLADLYYIEVFAINQDMDIEVFNFSNERDAIVAFTMWLNYMDNVVFENCKNF